jgi:hypothetical protein
MVWHNIILVILVVMGYKRRNIISCMQLPMHPDRFICTNSNHRILSRTVAREVMIAAAAVVVIVMVAVAEVVVID